MLMECFLHAVRGGKGAIDADAATARQPAVRRAKTTGGLLLAQASSTSKPPEEGLQRKLHALEQIMAG